MTAAATTDDELKRIVRVRGGVRVILALGIAASVAANVLHAQDNAVGRVVAAWPPVALALTVELLARVPVHNAWLASLRWMATVAVAGIAAWISYWHMVGVALQYGESTSSAHLIPLSVDGLVVVASVCLVELGGRINALTAPADQEETSWLVPDQEETSWLVPSPTHTALPVVTEPTDTGPALVAGSPRPVSTSRPATPAATPASSARLRSVPPLPAEQHEPAQPPAPEAGAEPTAAGTGSDVADLLAPAREIARQHRDAGQRLTRSELLKELRSRGLTVSTQRGSDLLRIIREAADHA